MIGEAVGSYTIVSELGRGGMGVVYLAQHRHLGWKAAIKFLQPEYSERPDALQRFFTEARAASVINHEGIVRVLDCDLHPSGQAYIVMEYLEGQTLREHLVRRGRLSVPEAATIMARVGRALAAAHGQGIVHRDLKPDNIFVLARPPGAVKIVDFGVAKLIRGDGSPSRTLSGAVLGTPLYMSPEQARGAGTLDGRADVYAFGCILFELLCGRPPFVYDGTGELIAAHLAQPPPAPESLAAELPPTLRALLGGLLAKAADDRPSLTEEVLPTLQAFASVAPLAPPATEVLPAGTPSTPVGSPWPVVSPRPAGTPPEGGGGKGTPSERERPRRRRPVLAVAVAASAVVGLGLVLWRGRELRPGPAGNAVDPGRPAPAIETAGAGEGSPPRPASAAAARAGQAPRQEGRARGAAQTSGQAEPVAGQGERTAGHDPGARRGQAVAPARGEAREAQRGERPAREARAPTAASAGRGGRPGPARGSERSSFAASAGAASVPSGVQRVRLTSEPPGAVVCATDNRVRLGTTNGSVELPVRSGRTVLLLYRPGFHLERVAVAPGETSRSVRLRPLTDDDLQAPPPCR